MTSGKRRLAAIMFTDMVGFSATAQSDEAGALRLLATHNRLLRSVFTRFRGREIKTAGDAFLVEFESALEAVNCALEVQRTLHDHNRQAAARERIRVRIGLHVGDVVQTEGDVLGDAVNVASRIEPLAEPGGICVTQQVFDQVQNKLSVSLVRLPPRPLKNIQFPVTVYKVLPPWEGSPVGPAALEQAGLRHLAVLPLSNISPDPKDEYFADGLTEELISTLSHVRELSVIARTSVIPYKNASKSIAQVGAELSVDTVLEGSVRKAGNRLRITLQLIDVPTQRHIWASSYNREIDDVFAVQTDIAERTAEALRLELTSTGLTEAERRPTANLVAYDAYLRGLVASRVDLGKGIETADRYFEQATRLDPTFAEAYAAWANLYVEAAGDYLSYAEVIPKARKLAARALELDADSSEAHAALGNILLQFDNDWAGSEREFRAALERNPSNMPALRFYGLLLMTLQRYDEAKEVYRRLIRIDPAGHHQEILAWAELETGNFAATLAQAEANLANEPNSVARHTYMGLFYLQAGRPDDALRQADSPTTGANDTELFDRAMLNALLGRPADARREIARVEAGQAGSYTSRSHLAMLYSSLGDGSKALDLLEQEFREGDRLLWLYARGVFFDHIRKDPRFLALLRQYGLPAEKVADVSMARRAPPSSPAG